MDAKSYLIEILEYYKYKLKDDKCTKAEIDSVTSLLEKNLKIYGTIKDFAAFYDKPESQVRVNIFRKVFAKPIRAVLYPFNEFHKAVSSNWKHNK